VKEAINMEIYQHLNEIISKTPFNITIEQIDYEYIFYNLNIDDAIKAYVENEIAELKAEYYMDSERYSPSSDDWRTIDKIFS
jgi:predicted SprT family Zn-dependent metalloprotease